MPALADVTTGATRLRRPETLRALLRQAVRLDCRRAFCAPVVQRRDGTSAPVNKTRGFIVRALPSSHTFPRP